MKYLARFARQNFMASHDYLTKTFCTISRFAKCRGSIPRPRSGWVISTLMVDKMPISKVKIPRKIAFTILLFNTAVVAEKYLCS